MRDWQTIFRIEEQDDKYPLYHQISLSLKTLIQKGVLYPGEMLPSEEEMGGYYGVSRLTMRRAIDDLVRESWLSRKHGIGTFVASPNITPTISRTLSFTDKMRALGLYPSSRLVRQSIIQVPEDISTRLHLTSGTQVIEIIRVRLADNQPIMVESAYLSAELFSGLLTADFSNHSLYESLREKYQVTVAWIDQILEPGLVSEEEAPLLGVKAGSLGLISHVLAFAQDGVAIEYSRSITLAEKCRFMFHFRERAPQA